MKVTVFVGREGRALRALYPRRPQGSPLAPDAARPA